MATAANTSPVISSLTKYQAGILVSQHLVLPPTRSQPKTGTFSYHLRGRPQAQWLYPRMVSFLGTRSTITPIKEARLAPNMKAMKMRNDREAIYKGVTRFRGIRMGRSLGLECTRLEIHFRGLLLQVSVLHSHKGYMR